jgi:trk system potassium uptake protein TrkA
MKIIILGAGHVGYSLAKQLSFDEHDVSIIDHDDKTLKKISEKLDVRSVIGNAVDVETLKEAGGNDADIIIAATSSDEVNIVACQIAGFMFGVETKIARLSNKSYFINNELFGKNNFTIDLIASPEIEIS